MAQYARPIADTLVGAWTNAANATANLWQSIDEDPADDADFAQSSLTVNDAYEVRLSAVDAALIGRGHILRVRARKNQAAGNTRGVTIELRQGATVIASQSIADLTVLWPTAPLALTPAQAAAITDYTDLRVRFTATGTVSGNAATRRRVQVSWAQLRVPEATFGAVATLTGPPVWRYTLGGKTGEGATALDALVDLFTQLQAFDPATYERNWRYVYYARKIRDYTALRAAIVGGTYQLPPHQTQIDGLAICDDKLARFDTITADADTQDGG